MIQFEYDSIMKRYNVLVPFTLADETSRELDDMLNNKKKGDK